MTDGRDERNDGPRTWKVRGSELVIANDREALARLVGENDALAAEDVTGADGADVNFDAPEARDGDGDGIADGDGPFPTDRNRDGIADGDSPFIDDGPVNTSPTDAANNLGFLPPVTPPADDTTAAHPVDPIDNADTDGDGVRNADDAFPHDARNI